MSKMDVLLGLQWGDEGKGKAVDVLCPRYEVVARFQGGPNAGHTLVFDGRKHVLHTIPSGIFHPHISNVVGNGVVIDPVAFRKECENLIAAGVQPAANLLLSEKVHLILPTHKILDAASEAAKGKEKIGSTLRGIGPTYMDKTGRNGLRVGDIVHPDFTARYEFLRNKHLELIKSLRFAEFSLEEREAEFFEALEYLKTLPRGATEYAVNNALNAEKTVLAEGAQGTLLDIEFGSYPFVTSSHTLAAGACIGLGVSPTRIGNVYGIFKAYCTRVGSGPFPTELFCETGEAMRKEGNEFGATTGRPRRCGWLDLPALRYAVMLNGVTHLMMMKADVLRIFEEVKVCTAYRNNGNETQEFPFMRSDSEWEPVYATLPGWTTLPDNPKTPEELPDGLQQFIAFIEDYVKVPVYMVSLGPEREKTLFRQ